MNQIGQIVKIKSGRYEGLLGEVIAQFPKGELCDEEVYQVKYALSFGTTMGQFKASELFFNPSK